DFLIETRKKTFSQSQQLTAIEVKFTKKWQNKWSQNLKQLMDKTPKINKAYGIYRGTEILTQNCVTILPLQEFLKRMYRGEIF
ncbi:MAG: hypothetical protein ACOYOK_07110, partial [Pseudobdellovibrionaceae bacterium]